MARLKLFSQKRLQSINQWYNKQNAYLQSKKDRATPRYPKGLPSGRAKRYPKGRRKTHLVAPDKQGIKD